jgi:hypothetical protein
MDEHAWCDVVQLVLQPALRIAGGSDPNFILEINNVQSQAVDSAFLPQIRKHDVSDSSQVSLITTALA